MSAGHAVVPQPPTPHQIPVLPRCKQSAAELLQSHCKRAGDSADTNHKCQRDASASEQRQIASYSWDFQLLRGQEPSQREEDGGGPAAGAQRPQ